MTAEIIPFPTWETGYPEIDEIMHQAADNPDIVSAVQNAHSSFDAVLAIRSEITSLFPQVLNFPDRPDDPDFQQYKVQQPGDDQTSIVATNTLYIATKIAKFLRHE